jgi:4-hydroxy-tetrahydrodipicolinate synthase
MTTFYKGIIVPMITPLSDPYTLDPAGLEKLIEHLVEGGVHGLFILGTTGEAQSLGYPVRKELVEQVCKQVAGRIPVLVGITDTSPTQSIWLADIAAKNGADAVVAAPPYYFTPSRHELEHYYMMLADSVSLPLMLYNMPSHTRIHLTTELVATLAAHENIVGLKDSSGDLIYFQKTMAAMESKPDFSMLIGPEELLMPALMAGCDGGVSGGANMFPQLYVGMYDAFLERDFTKMNELQKLILYVSSTIYAADTYGGGYLQGLKCAVSLLGICHGTVASPLLSIQEDQKNRVRQTLAQMRKNKYFNVVYEADE